MWWVVKNKAEAVVVVVVVWEAEGGETGRSGHLGGRGALGTHTFAFPHIPHAPTLTVFVPFLSSHLTFPTLFPSKVQLPYRKQTSKQQHQKKKSAVRFTRVTDITSGHLTVATRAAVCLATSPVRLSNACSSQRLKPF